MHPQVEKFRSESQRRSFEEGRNEGSVATAAANVLDILDARGLAVSREQHERILACSDLVMLKTWVRRAATIATTEELFL